MAEKDETAMANEGLDALARLLPDIYQDLAQPATREVGLALRDVISVLLIRNPEFNKKILRLAKKLSGKIPKKRIIALHPQIGGPALEGMRFVTEPLLEEMYLELLARAMDKKRVSQAHPSFVHIISQLSTDEALILCFLKKEARDFRMKAELISRPTLWAEWKIINQTIFEIDLIKNLMFPDNMNMYLSHLESLNLCSCRSFLNTKQKTKLKVIKAELSEFGNLFALACVPDDLPKSQYNSGTASDV